jgi:hypothetical protein
MNKTNQRIEELKKELLKLKVKEMKFTSKEMNDMIMAIKDNNLVWNLKHIRAESELNATIQTLKEVEEVINKYENVFCDLCEDDFQKLKKELGMEEKK